MHSLLIVYSDLKFYSVLSETVGLHVPNQECKDLSLYQFDFKYCNYLAICAFVSNAISWNSDMLNWSLVCSIIYSENIFAWNILHIIFWWYDKAYHYGAGSNCFSTNLLSQLCELWPHFCISLTLHTCCCTPHLLVILDTLNLILPTVHSSFLRASAL